MTNQTKQDNLRLVNAVGEFGRLLIKRARVQTSVNVSVVSEEDGAETVGPFDLGTDALEAANEVCDVLYRVADISGADPSVLLIAAGKLLARYGAMYGESPQSGDAEERGAENAAFTAAGGFILGMQAFVADLKARENEEDFEDDEDAEDDEMPDAEDDEDVEAEDDSDEEDEEGGADDAEDELDTTGADVRSDYPTEEDEDEDDEADESFVDFDEDVHPPKEEPAAEPNVAEEAPKPPRPSFAGFKHKI